MSIARGAARLGRRELFAFGLLSVPLATGGLPVALYLAPFYARELGLGLTGLGVVLTLIRLTDVVNRSSDRRPVRPHPARFGRRACGSRSACR